MACNHDLGSDEMRYTQVEEEVSKLKIEERKHF